ncbi:MAG TPA: tetratricopeptide repeat protein [Cyclobacteriaceae bacterium]|nr:tetratricopeptide repeat protein [Cyclobacteriaceae bacterium]
MTYRPIFIFLLAFSVTGFAQNKIADSLTKGLRKHLREDSTRVELLNQLAFERYFDHPTEAANYCLEAGRIADKINYLKGKSQAYRMMGLTFWAQANLSAALNYFVKGLKLADSIGNKQIQADITGNIGLVYIGMGNHSTALHFFKASVRKQREMKNVLREAAMLNNVGDCYFRMNKFDSALFTYSQALELGKSKKFGIATNIRNIGNVYEAIGDLEKALAYYSKAKTISDSLSDHRGMTLVRKSIASIFYQQKKYAFAEKLLNECLTIALQSRLKAVTRDSYELLSKIANAQGRDGLALEHFKLFTLYKDSVQNLSESAKISSLQLEYETHRKQTEIDSLKKESRLKTILLTSAGCGILIALFFLFSSVRNYYRVKLHNNEILVLNEQIKKQRDSSVEKSIKIESLHKELSEINKSLEDTIEQRTEALKDQTKHMEAYAFITAHKLRAPLARVMGIVNLLERDVPMDEQRLLLEHLKNASGELDSVIRSLSHALQQGMDKFDVGIPAAEDSDHRSTA